MSPINDRRRFSRIPFDGRVEITGAQDQYETELLDISLNGILVDRPGGFDPATDKEVTITVHGPEDAYAINMKAVIGHTEDSILGFQCVEIDIDSITELRRLVELNLGDNSMLNRELAELCKPV